MPDTLAPPTPGSVDEGLHQTLKKFVNGLPDDATEFINNVLLHPDLRYPIDSKEKLEELGAQAKFRDRVRSVMPVGFGLGFAPASTVGAVLPSHVAKNLLQAIPANVATTFLSPLLNRLAVEVKKSGQLGSKYRVSEDANSEMYFLLFAVTYVGARAIAQLGGASPIASNLARIWGGGLVGDAILGLRHQLDYEKRLSEGYPFLDVSDKPEESREKILAESRAKIIALQQKPSVAALGYLKDFATAFYQAPRNIPNAICAPDVWAASIALLPSAVFGTAAGYLSNKEKATYLTYLSDLAGPVGWTGRNLVHQAGARIFSGLRWVAGSPGTRQPDLEMGMPESSAAPTLPELPAHVLRPTPLSSAIPQALLDSASTIEPAVKPWRLRVRSFVPSTLRSMPSGSPDGESPAEAPEQSSAEGTRSEPPSLESPNQVSKPSGPLTEPQIQGSQSAPNSNAVFEPNADEALARLFAEGGTSLLRLNPGLRQVSVPIFADPTQNDGVAGCPSRTPESPEASAARPSTSRHDELNQLFSRILGVLNKYIPNATRKLWTGVQNYIKAHIFAAERRTGNKHEPRIDDRSLHGRSPNGGAPGRNYDAGNPEQHTDPLEARSPTPAQATLKRLTAATQRRAGATDEVRSTGVRTG
jgi:hypothetical protein